ncbi:SDR family NAD(P)-dependent oxidoreductase [Limnohabitans sp. Rim11]|uniref:SDR family NAD(P)-dependent oxidoreductase n=1 Tax=Limnohabitans sp. Rim11 TaxID=1100719 RepID=UPI000A7DF75E|nr:SDR family oxidoreductase [Limnohabitans sp. Rim11]
MNNLTVMITGAASGIGLATAHFFAEKNWRCILVDCDEVKLRDLSKALPNPTEGFHSFECLDLTSTQDIAALASRVTSLDVLINNAGITDSLNVPLVNQTEANFRSLLKLNLQVPADLTQALNASLKPGAHIINVASGAGLKAIPWRGAYSTSKAGLIAQTQALAKARPDLCVTVLCPGFVRTDLVERLIASGRLKVEAAVAKIPLGRIATPDEMAEALYFLATPAAVQLSGQQICVDGGSSVFGGSQPYATAAHAPRSSNTPLALNVKGGEVSDWLPPSTLNAESPYLACLNLSLMSLKPEQALNQLCQVATEFANEFTAQASLTVLIPLRLGESWQDAGHNAAIRMLISSLACEWGPQSLRINALEIPSSMSACDVAPVVHFLAGASAQYITGQTWVLNPPTKKT